MELEIPGGVKVQISGPQMENLLQSLLPAPPKLPEKLFEFPITDAKVFQETVVIHLKNGFEVTLFTTENKLKVGLTEHPSYLEFLIDKINGEVETIVTANLPWIYPSEVPAKILGFSLPFESGFRLVEWKWTCQPPQLTAPFHLKELNFGAFTPEDFKLPSLGFPTADFGKFFDAKIVSGSVDPALPDLHFRDWALSIDDKEFTLDEFQLNLKDFQLSSPTLGLSCSDILSFKLGAFLELEIGAGSRAEWDLEARTLTFKKGSRISLFIPNKDHGFEFQLLPDNMSDILKLGPAGATFEASIAPKKVEVKAPSGGFQFNPLPAHLGQESRIKVENSQVVRGQFWASGPLPCLKDAEVLAHFQVTQPDRSASPEFRAVLELRGGPSKGLFRFDEFDWFRAQIDDVRLGLSWDSGSNMWQPIASADLALELAPDKLSALSGFSGLELPRSLQFEGFDLLKGLSDPAGVKVRQTKPTQLSLLNGLVGCRMHEPTFSKRGDSWEIRFERVDFQVESPGSLRIGITTAAVVLEASPLKGRFSFDFGSSVGIEVEFGGGASFKGSCSWRDDSQEKHLGASGELKLEGISPIQGRLKFGAAKKNSGRWAPLLAIFLEKDHEFSILSNLHLRRAGIGLGVNQALSGLEGPANAEELLSKIDRLEPNRLENWKFVEQDGFYLSIVGSLWMTAAPLANDKPTPYVVWTLLHLDTDFKFAVAAKLWLLSSLNFARDNSASPAMAGVVLFQPKEGTLQALAETRPSPATQAGDLLKAAMASSQMRMSLFVSTRATDLYLEYARYRFNFLGVDFSYESSFRIAIFERNVLLRAKQTVRGFYSKECSKGKGGFRFKADIEASFDFGALVGGAGLVGYGSLALRIAAEVYAWIKISFCGYKKKFSIDLDLQLDLEGTIALDNGKCGFRGVVGISVSVCGYRLRIRPSLEINEEVIDRVKAQLAAFERRLDEFKLVARTKQKPQPEAEAAKWFVFKRPENVSLVYPANQEAWSQFRLEKIERDGAGVTQYLLPALKKLEILVPDSLTSDTPGLEQASEPSPDERRLLLFQEASRTLSQLDSPQTEVLQDPRPFSRHRAYWSDEERFSWPDFARPATFRPILEVEANGEGDHDLLAAKLWEKWSLLGVLEAETLEANVVDDEIEQARAMLLQELLADSTHQFPLFTKEVPEEITEARVEPSTAPLAELIELGHPAQCSHFLEQSGQGASGEVCHVYLPLRWRGLETLGQLNQHLRRFTTFTLTRREASRTDEVVLAARLPLNVRQVSIGGETRVMVSPYLYVDTVKRDEQSEYIYTLYPNDSNGERERKGLAWPSFRPFLLQRPLPLLCAQLSGDDLAKPLMPSKFVLLEVDSFQKLPKEKRPVLYYEKRPVGQWGFFAVDDGEEKEPLPHEAIVDNLRLSAPLHTPVGKTEIGGDTSLEAGFSYRFFYRHSQSDLLTPLAVALGQGDARRFLEWVEPFAETDTKADIPGRLSALPVASEEENFIRIQWVQGSPFQGGVRLTIEDLDESHLRYEIEREVYSTESYQAAFRNLSVPATWQDVHPKPPPTALLDKSDVERVFFVDLRNSSLLPKLCSALKALLESGPDPKKLGNWADARQRYLQSPLHQGSPAFHACDMLVRSLVLKTICFDTMTGMKKIDCTAEQGVLILQWVKQCLKEDIASFEEEEKGSPQRYQLNLKLLKLLRLAEKRATASGAQILDKSIEELQRQIRPLLSTLPMPALPQGLFAPPANPDPGWREVPFLALALASPARPDPNVAANQLKAAELASAQRTIPRALGLTRLLDLLESSDTSEYAVPVGWKVWKQPRMAVRVQRPNDTLELLPSLIDDALLEPPKEKNKSEAVERAAAQQLSSLPLAASELLGDGEPGAVVFFNLLERLGFAVECRLSDNLGAPVAQDRWVQLIKRAWKNLQSEQSNEDGMEELADHSLLLLLPRQGRLDAGPQLRGVRFPLVKLAVVPNLRKVSSAKVKAIISNRGVLASEEEMAKLLDLLARYLPQEEGAGVDYEIEPRGESFLAIPSDQGSCQIYWRCPDRWGHRYRVTAQFLDRYRGLRPSTSGKPATTHCWVLPHPKSLPTDLSVPITALPSTRDIQFSYLLPADGARSMVNNLAGIRSGYRGVDVAYFWKLSQWAGDWTGLQLVDPPFQIATKADNETKIPPGDANDALFPMERQQRLPQLPYLLEYVAGLQPVYQLSKEPQPGKLETSKAANRLPGVFRVQPPQRKDLQFTLFLSRLRDHLTAAEETKYRALVAPPEKLDLADPFMAYSLYLARNDKKAAPLLEPLAEVLMPKHPRYVTKAPPAPEVRVLQTEYIDENLNLKLDAAKDFRFYLIAERNGVCSEPIEIKGDGP